ncbi:hypothetical protein CONLIGDRAFT_101104 [Coniochaeta ligniaria NRRL 30616]|uniref:Heterokaryon incompatibility domain-containing protein n=1 Tax=Coniochaeta ligniaria NRRL 30616 TaxID=1408157 RepID=A0A1J7JAN7_9PEZI|nr:hypothetical protein CONLIGDRAFT_101104 [Coniochaeta ligniaria NRRL 30616]
MPSPSIFEPLNPALSEIRLLRLLPGKADEPIRCTLHIVSLNKPPRFEAISYVCGDPADTRTILVNGQRLDVTVNLEDALRGLRLDSRSRRLWADAICIHQDNIEEKNKQILEMANIYRQASRVLVWLGEPSINVRAAVSWAQRHRKIKPFLHHTKLKIMSFLSTTTMGDYLEERERAACGSLNVFAHRYWTRMWTYQEYMLARVTPLLVWRGLNIPSEVLRTGGRKETEKLTQGTGGHLSARFAADESLGQDLLEISRSWERAQLFLHAEPLNLEDGNVTLEAVLTETLSRRCSDPRDLVYGLYGFFPALQSAYPPDYNKSVQQVMHDTTVYLAGTGGLSVHAFYSLYENRLCTGSDSTITTPSWVLDLTRPLLEAGLPNAPHPRYSPHQFTSHSFISEQLQYSRKKLEISSSGRILRLPGRKLRDLHCIIRFSNDVDQILLQVIDLLVLIDDMDPAILETQPWQNIRAQARSNLSDRLVQVLLDVDLFLVSTSCHKFLDELHRLLESLRVTGAKVPATEHELDLNDEVWRVENWLLNLRHKAVFVTMGCIGITVGDMCESDEIVVPDGFVQPAVLRRTMSEESDAEEFKLVGFAYVDGVMDNEFEDPELVTEILQRERRIYNVC